MGERTACLDCCFDCTVLWDTLTTYAKKNGLDPYCILGKMQRYHVYSPTDPSARTWLEHYNATEGLSRKQRWWDVESALQGGLVMEAISALEFPGEDDREGTDWDDIADMIAVQQPCLAKRLRRSLK